MNHGEYRTMFNLETRYWWFLARRKLLHELVAELSGKRDDLRLLDVGCGTGLNCSVLSDFGEAFGADASTEALRFSKSRGLNNLVLSTVENLKFDNDSFDVVVAMDLLEHTDNDLIAMREIWRVTKPGGNLIVTVPAYGFLWSEHDEALHHRRRYTAHELRNKLVNAGFEVRRSSYFITLLFFPIFFLRILQNLTKKSLQATTSHIMPPKFVNWLLVKVLDLERLYLRISNLPFGVTVLAIAQKPVDPVPEQSFIQYPEFAEVSD